ncbi:hypothetical protein QBC41DRAFT_137403 [Cercophora samala]|uniref:Uncharacterized protein n=1 Tax=Cercophora samala TaxID=330535 RepID=A0AA40DA56_9PEZI|nr:hypothetical protein QBC41DRAFT_137403 [Cercophora samala]
MSPLLSQGETNRFCCLSDLAKKSHQADCGIDSCIFPFSPLGGELQLGCIRTAPVRLRLAAVTCPEENSRNVSLRPRTRQPIRIRVFVHMAAPRTPTFKDGTTPRIRNTPVPQSSSVTTPVTCLMRGSSTVMAIILLTFHRSLPGSTWKVQSHEFHLTSSSARRCPEWSKRGNSISQQSGIAHVGDSLGWHYSPIEPRHH